MMTQEENDFVDLIINTHAALKGAADLSPNNTTINNTLDKYVAAVLAADNNGLDTTAILSHPVVETIRPAMLGLLWKAETQMEHYFSDQFVNQHRETGETPDLTKFWYLKNYMELVEDEANALARSTDKPIKNIAFVGSGPLPLSALILHQLTGAHITCIDIDAEASQKGAAFISTFDMPPCITHLNADGRNVDYSGFDMVFIATMTGDKEGVVDRIKKTAAPDVIVAVRSVENLRSLLYNPINEEDFQKHGFVKIGSVTARETVINCTEVFQEASSTQIMVPPPGLEYNQPNF